MKTTRPSARLRRLPAASWAFIWDFIGGETPEVPLTTIVIVALAFALRHERMAAVIALPIVVLTGIMVGVWRARGTPLVSRPETASSDEAAR